MSVSALSATGLVLDRVDGLSAAGVPRRWADRLLTALARPSLSQHSCPVHFEVPLSPHAMPCTHPTTGTDALTQSQK